MQIHIIRSVEVLESLVEEIMKQLIHHQGPAQFVAAGYFVEWEPGDFNHLRGYPSLTKSQFYQKCRLYRAESNISPDAVVVLLTDHPDVDNWFSAGEDGGARNFFIHTAGWDSFVESDPVYPLIYELVSAPLLVAAYPGYEIAAAAAHHAPLGCYLDMCQNKADIHLKMRTADVCPSCRKHFLETGIDPALVRQVLSTYEDIRKQMLYRERLELLNEPAVMEVNIAAGTLYFPSINPTPIKLRPQEMLVYSFFLNHPKGVAFSRLADHKAELVSVYLRTSKKISLTEIEDSISKLVDTKRNNLNPVINRINKKITQKLGTRIDQQYQIHGGGRKHRIPIDRQYVVRRSVFG
jgi:hypothetical protein